MPSPTIYGLSLLTASFDTAGRDYLELFVPLVAECLRTSSSSIVASHDLRQALHVQFGVALPEAVISSLIDRAIRHGYVVQTGLIYEKRQTALDNLDFAQRRDHALRVHETLITALKQYCEEQHSVCISEQDADDALLSYLENSDIGLTSTPLPATTSSSSDTAIDHHYLVGRFIMDINEHAPEIFDHVVAVARGQMLMNAIYVTKVSKKNKPLSELTLYLDAPLMAILLGYATDVEVQFYDEFLNLVRELGAKLRCFEHSFDELRGILINYSRLLSLRHLQDVTVEVRQRVETLLAKTYTPGRVEFDLQRLDRSIDAIGIKRIAVPDDNANCEWNHDELFNVIQNETRKGKIAVDRDVYSVMAIVHLRRGVALVDFQKCRTVFVTANRSLERATQEFFYRMEDRPGIFPCVLATRLTSIMWLLRPTSAPSLPRKRVIADCVAAVQPNDRLWSRFVDEIDRLSTDKLISSSDYFLLRYTYDAKFHLMNLVKGDAEAYYEGTADHVLATVKDHLAESIRRELDTTKGKADELIAVDRARKVRFDSYADRLAATMVRLCFGFILILVIADEIWVFAGEPNGAALHIVRVLAGVIGGGAGILAVLHLVFGWSVLDLTNRLRAWLAARIRRALAAFAE